MNHGGFLVEGKISTKIVDYQFKQQKKEYFRMGFIPPSEYDYCSDRSSKLLIFKVEFIRLEKNGRISFVNQEDIDEQFEAKHGRRASIFENSVILKDYFPILLTFYR